VPEVRAIGGRNYRPPAFRSGFPTILEVLSATLPLQDEVRVARDSPVIGLKATTSEEGFGINLTWIQTCLQQFCCPAAGLAFQDCSESENIQHAIGADGNPLESVHGEGDRV
jgi:hypothetical protein